MAVRRTLLLALWGLGCGPEPVRDRPADVVVTRPREVGEETGAPPVGRNILVILLDDLGVDKVASYGLHPEPAFTPTIDSLAAQGVLFERAYANPTCSPTRAMLLTGRYGRRTGVGSVADFYTTTYSLPHAEVLIPEMLATSPTLSYTSVASGKWHLAVSESPAPFRDPHQQGFARYAGPIENLILRLKSAEEGGYYAWDRNNEGTVAFETTYATTREIDDAIERITGASEPWFGYVALSAPHGPLDLPPPSLYTVPVPDEALDDKAALTAAVLEAADTEIGRLLATIGPDVLARTTVVLLGDNGTTQSAILPPWDPTRSKNTLFEGGVRVPMIVTGPFVGQPGSRVSAMVSLVDIFPTLAEIGEVDLTNLTDAEGEPVALDGTSLLPYLLDPDSPPQRRRIYGEEFTPNGAPPYTVSDIRMLRDETYKLILKSGEEPQFFKFAKGEFDEGENLLLGGVDALSETDRNAYKRLDFELGELSEKLTYDGPPTAL